MKEHKLPENIQQSIYSALPGFNFREWPTGFGWAPDRHFRGTLQRGEIDLPVVIRQSWSESGFDIERHLYKTILRNLRIKTPKMHAAFGDPSSGSFWLILEDMGTETATNIDVYRKEILQLLAVLHATGESLTSCGDVKLACFPANHDFFGRWDEIIEKCVDDRAYEVSRRILSALRALKSYISNTRPTFIHGDTDFSNFVLTGGDVGIGVIDWERACLGPSLLDVSRIISVRDRYNDIAAYRQSYEAERTGNPNPIDERKLADFSVFFESIRWVCYFLDKVDCGSDPGIEWRDQYFLPALQNAQHIAELL